MNAIKLIALFTLLCVTKVGAQDNLQTYTLKKGEVFDVLLLKTVDDPETLYDRYKKTAFPVAIEYGYDFLPGFGVKTPILGTQPANGFLFGKWKNKLKRESFLKDISSRVPDFHEQRLNLFSLFKLA